MKLLRQLERLEERAGGALAGRAVGLVWSDCEQLPCDMWELQPGQAVDVYDLGELGGVPRWKLIARPAREAGDLGDVYGEGGEVVGRVVRVSGQLVEVEDVAPAAPRPPARKVAGKRAG